MRVSSSYSAKLSCCFVRSFSSSSSSVFAGRRLVGTPVFSSSSSSSALSSRIAGSQKRRSTAPGFLSFTMDATSTGASASAAEVAKKSIYDFVVKDIDGNDVELSTFKGKVLLIVNVASQCGLTQQNYKELAELYKKHKENGLEILAFPTNQFGGQEPGSNEQIKDFACTKFKAEYPIFSKVNVNGPEEAPVYKFLKANKGGGILGDSIKWNFGKFLVDKEGNVVDRYAPTTSPLKIEKDIQKLLAA
ncbi:unnamed protein product [Sphagnum troendelagicum]|uniref:Uncharacterized protein n=2 Tax=Sphagnum jensenii TaxID=128206 RepID=A0ABP0W328_9BRYO